MADVVFFLKSLPNASVKALTWPSGTRLIPVDLGPWRCGGVDPLCSSGYVRMHAALRDSSGRVLPNFLKRYARGVNVTRVSFIGFSAAHGFLNKLAENDADRADIDAYVLADATFGGGKTGYKKFAADAARGKRLLVTTTSNTGGDEAWRLVWNAAQELTGKSPRRTEARPPVPEPSGGAWQLGALLYYLRYVDAQGKTELPHWEMGHVLAPLCQGYLIPYLNGKLGGLLPWWVWGLLGAGAVGAAGFTAVQLSEKRS